MLGPRISHLCMKNCTTIDDISRIKYALQGIYAPYDIKIILSFYQQRAFLLLLYAFYKCHAITTLAAIPTAVASSAPGSVHLVFFTFAAI